MRLTPAVASDKVSGPAVLRFLRMLHGFFFVYSFGLVYAARLIPRATTGPGAAFVDGISVVAALTALGVIALRVYRANPVLQRLREEGDSPEMLKRLRFFDIWSATLMIAVLLDGFVLYVMGAPIKLAATIGGASLLLQVVFWPRNWMAN